MEAKFTMKKKFGAKQKITTPTEVIVAEILDFYLKFYIFEIRLNLNCEEKIKTSFSGFLVCTDLSDWIGAIWVRICQPQHGSR
jgi:hypothetical protein